MSDSRTLEAAGEALMRALLEARVLSEAFAGPLRTLTESWGAVGGQVYALQGSEQGAEWSFRGSFGPFGAAVHPTPLQLERLRTGEQLSSVPYHHALYGCSQVLGQGLWSENTLVGVLWLGFDAEPRWLLEPLEGLCRLWGRQLERLRVREPETLLAAQLGDKSLDVWRFLAWNLTRAREQGRDYMAFVLDAISRARADHQEGFARSAGALLIKRLREAGVWDALQQIPQTRVASPPN